MKLEEFRDRINMDSVYGNDMGFCRNPHGWKQENIKHRMKEYFFNIDILYFVYKLYTIMFPEETLYLFL